MGQYTGSYRRIATFLFEHDIYFQSILRSLHDRNRRYSRFTAFYEYLRALRFELHLLPQFDRIQVCSPANKSYLVSYLPQIAVRIDDHLRAGIDVTSYVYHPGPRRPDTVLFLGSFRHAPNLEALGWFLSRVMPLLLKQYPQARLMVAGSELPQGFVVPAEVSHGVTVLGFVDDVRVPLSEFAVFIAPILSGSGIRVKLLEAFAAGIPVVATSLGAEGLAASDGDVCRIADDPAAFAAAIHQLLEHPEQGEQLAARARQVVEQRWDLVGATQRLAATYRKVVAAKRSAESRRDGAMPGS
jgi:O-antigen biosynthesis protein